jgi:hypothetical protein
MRWVHPRMHKPTNKLTLTINTLRSLQTPSLATVAGARTIFTEAESCVPSAHPTCPPPKTGSCTQ